MSDINAYFLHPSVNEELKLEIIIERLAKPCKHLWRENEIAKRFDPPNPSATTIISWAQNNYQEAQDGFHPNAEIYGLKIVLINSPLPMARAQVLWRTLIESPHLLRGFVLKAKRVGSLSHAPRSPEFSCAGKRLLVEDWLPDKGGDWHKPNELLLTDLHNGFETNSVRVKEVAESLGMKRPEQAQALEKLGQGDPRRMKLLERIASATYDELGVFEKLVPKDIEPQPAPPFKDGLKGLSRPQRGETSQGSTNLAPVSNLGRYQNKLDENVEDAFKAHLVTPHTVTFSPVRIQESNSDARNFLYSEYQGRCQLTGHTFLKASANAEGEAENYFEACALLSYSNASYLNDAGNMLSVSADTMAKFKHASVEWVDDLEKVIERFKNREPGNTATASIRLAGEEALITWSERHFMRLIALWNKA